jgi:hypothetical protein
MNINPYCERSGIIDSLIDQYCINIVTDIYDK